MAIGIGTDGFRHILGVAEGEREDLEGWRGFLRYLKDRGLSGVRLIISDACRGLVEAAGETFPDADWQRCVVHFYRNVFSHVPNTKIREIARMLTAIHAQEDRKAADAKSKEVAARMKSMKLPRAAELVEQKAAETLTYSAYPSTHWRQIRTNNPLERIIREIRRRTRGVGAFPDGKSALMLVAARLGHIASTKLGQAALPGDGAAAQPRQAGGGCLMSGSCNFPTVGCSQPGIVANRRQAQPPGSPG